VNISVKWKRELEFEATTVKGKRLVLDGNSKAAPSPTEALLTSLASCIAIDVVLVLSKMRLDLEGLEADVHAERAETPPRYFKKIQISFRVAGPVPEQQLNRAIRLSVDRYCSVLHSLRPDLELNWTVTQTADRPS